MRRDLDTFGEAPTTSSAALQGTCNHPEPLLSPCQQIKTDLNFTAPPGQISASLASLSRTIDDYSALSKRELIPAKQEKAFERVKNFRTELSDYREQFDRLRKEREDAVC